MLPNRITVAVTTVLLALTLTTSGSAQSPLTVGLSVGGVPLSSLGFAVLPEGAVHVVTDVDESDLRVRFSAMNVAIVFTSFGVEALLPLPVGEEQGLSPYVGAGVSASPFPLSLLGRAVAGVEFRDVGTVRPFAEVDLGVGFVQDLAGIQVLPSLRAGFLVRLP